MGRMKKASSQDTLLESCLSSLNLAGLAEESGWSAKSRKATALGWCLALCQACDHSAPSLRVAAHIMGLVNALTITRQAMHVRLRLGGAALLKGALEAAIAAKARLSQGPRLGAFARVLIQDSTVIALSKPLARHYPGASNQLGGSAAVKIQAVYDMAGNSFAHLALGAFTRNDQAAALDVAGLVGKDDLVLRDLGYFTLKSLGLIASKQAYFLSRYRSDLNLYDPDTGAEIDLLGLLRERGELDAQVLAGAEARLPARVIAVPLREEVANRRRQKAKSNRDRRLKPDKRSLELMGWQIMLTNCEQERLPREKARELYAMRWRIETIFKSWKSGLGMHRLSPRSSKQTVDAFLYAGLLRVTLVHAVLIPWLERRDPTRKVSVQKLMDLIAVSAQISGTDPQANENLLENLSKHCRYEKRKRLNTLEKWDLLVSEMEELI